MPPKMEKEARLGKYRVIEVMRLFKSVKGVLKRFPGAPRPAKLDYTWRRLC